MLVAAIGTSVCAVKDCAENWAFLQRLAGLGLQPGSASRRARVPRAMVLADERGMGAAAWCVQRKQLSTVQSLTPNGRRLEPHFCRRCPSVVADDC